MRLFAAGFNAWNQLRFSGPESEGEDVEPRDIEAFTCVLDGVDIQDVRSSLSLTSVSTSQGVLTAGAPTTTTSHNDTAPDCCVSLNGRAVVHDGQHIYQYASLDDVQMGGSGSGARRFRLDGSIVRVVAYDAGFAALTADGRVWTWGDGRFTECLGRAVDEYHPADRPGAVTALDDLPTGPVVKIAAGGYVLAALTRGRDLYCWGGYPGRTAVLQELAGEPTPVVVALGHEGQDGNVDGDGYGDDALLDTDVVDVGIGDAHMIVLLADGSVCVAGSNANGQLGLSSDSPADRQHRGASPAWARATSIPTRGVVAVWAGPRSSFIAVDSAASLGKDSRQ